MDKPSARIWNRNFTCVFISYFLLSFANMCINPLVSTYAKFLDAGPVLGGVLTGLHFGVAVAVRPITGPMTAKISNQGLMILVGILGVTANLGYIFFDSLASFTFFRILAGFMQGLIGSVFLAVASDNLPPAKLGAGIGFYGLAFVAAQTVGPIAGTSIRNYVTILNDEILGFRFVFLTAAVAAALSLVPGLVIKLKKKTKADLDSAGVWYKNIFAVRALPAAAMLTLAAISYNLYTAYIVPYGAALNIANIGVFFTVAAITGLCTRPIYGRLGDKFGLKVTLMPGFFLLVISLVIASRADSILILLISAVTGAMGFGAALPGLQAMSIQSLRRQKRGTASNTVSCGQDLGFFLSPILGSLVYSAADYQTMYLAGAVPSIVAAAILMFFWPAFKRWKAEALTDEIAE